MEDLITIAIDPGKAILLAQNCNYFLTHQFKHASDYIFNYYKFSNVISKSVKRRRESSFEGDSKMTKASNFLPKKNLPFFQLYI